VQLTGSSLYSANKLVVENKKKVKTKKNFFITKIN